MRGKAPTQPTPPTRKGITPAYAGKSTTALQKRFIQKDHPRLCGEKNLGELIFVRLVGSPPPMRGKETIKRNTSTVTRITPAYAGKRKSFSSIFKCSRDHPRLCGEKIFQDSGLIVLRGSPPPMRGKVLLKVRLNEMDGITPAYAGKRHRRLSVV